ncbi:uncharacterized protein (DUF2236 family) [Stackebrandtia endophytica]|uniref:Uncharacterized protein (DUF2236 family) n=1 Tax=Stackebrandtia endophytica TaxID=1496996 RepID=A0A543APU9_9ACTN|nr:oxygenase MpaB family protein [Stackebrandtia endophytica]TQL74612.1 uncharacterized protein (DUF2236 family) [Stackebrandtia endophytica]
MAGDQGLFGEGSVTWRVHLEPIMWIAGLRALYLQSLHPRVMRGVYQNSELFDRQKGWARFLRTARYVAIRTYGTIPETEAAGRRVRAIHSRLTGVDPGTGESFRVDEPALLRWVHCAEIASYADIAHRSGVISAADTDRYIDENRAGATLVGLNRDDVPGSMREMTDYFTRQRHRLRATPEGLRGLLNSFNPPLPRHLAPLRMAVPALNLLALASLPKWARRMLGIPVLPGADLVTTAQLRALRTAGSLTIGDQATAIAEARRNAHDMAAGTFVSVLDPKPADTGR